MRLFVSVDCDGLAEEIAAVQETIADASGVRLTDPENVHVTLKFLDEVEADRVSDLAANLTNAIDEADVEPFETAFGGLGAFPSEEYIRVIWVGVHEGSDELSQLHETIEDRTVEMGFDPADHEFTPHATIARMDHTGGKEEVQRTLREDDPTVGTLDVNEVRLTESVLDDDGPEYTTVERFAL